MRELKRWIVSQERGHPMLCQLVAWLDAARCAQQANFLRNRISGYLDALRDLGVINGEQCLVFGQEVDNA